MNKVLVSLLVLILVTGGYVLGTINVSKVVETPPASWTENSKAAQSWRELITSMEAAGAKVFAHTTDTRSRLEGLTYLTQLLAASLEMKVSKGDPSQPQFTDWMSDYRKFLGDSPDAIYSTAEISSDYRYEISGNINDVEYLGVMLYGRNSLNGWNRAAANISSKDLNIDEDGYFKIILSKSAPKDTSLDWLQLDSDVHMVMIRQYFHGREGKKEAKLTIDNLIPMHIAISSDKQVAKRIGGAVMFFNETIDGSIALAQMGAATPNAFASKKYSSDFIGIFYPTFDNTYYGLSYLLEDDQALVIEGTVPAAPYWSLTLQNDWMQSYESGDHPTALHDQQINTANGRYRVVVSHQKPAGEANWLSTAGHKQGTITFRYQRSSRSEQPSARVVKLSEL